MKALEQMEVSIAERSRQEEIITMMLKLTKP